MDYSTTKFVAMTGLFWDSIIEKSVEIRLTEDLINWHGEFQMKKAWDPEISVIAS